MLGWYGPIVTMSAGSAPAFFKRRKTMACDNVESLEDCRLWDGITEVITDCRLWGITEVGQEWQQFWQKLLQDGGRQWIKGTKFRRWAGNYRTFNCERQQIQNYTLNTSHDKIFAENSHHKWPFVGGPMTFPNKSKMANKGHIEFGKLLIFPYTIFAHNLVQTCNTGLDSLYGQELSVAF